MTTPTYDRAKFFGEVIDEDGITSTDPLDFEFSNLIEFLRTKKVKIRRISSAEEGAPDLISFQEYGNDQYWWVILLVNRIQDPINELVAGDEIAIPRLQDIEEFRQSQSSGSTRGETVILR